MTRSLLVLLMAGLSACATRAPDPPGCSGPRRPANPAGAALEPAAPTSPALESPAAACLRWRP